MKNHNDLSMTMLNVIDSLCQRLNAISRARWVETTHNCLFNLIRRKQNKICFRLHAPGKLVPVVTLSRAPRYSWVPNKRAGMFMFLRHCFHPQHEINKPGMIIDFAHFCHPVWLFGTHFIPGGNTDGHFRDFSGGYNYSARHDY